MNNIEKLKTRKGREELLQQRMRDLEDWTRSQEEDIYMRIRKLEKQMAKLLKLAKTVKLLETQFESICG
jgi:hypothetical protein